MNTNETANEIVHLKKALRQNMMAARKQMSQNEHDIASLKACEHMFDLIQKSGKKNIGIFLSIRGEINTAPLIDLLKEKSYTLSLPITGEITTPLTFREYRDETSLEVGKFNTKQPKADCKEVFPDFLVVPLLAYDSANYRLGYGGGHYDATILKLRKLHDVKCYGLAFSLQSQAYVPIEAHDIPLDGIVNEIGVY